MSKKKKPALTTPRKYRKKQSKITIYSQILSSVKSFLPHIRQGVEACGKHPFVTGLFALLGLAGLLLSIYSFYIDREEDQVTTQKIESSSDKIVETILNKYQQDIQTKDEQIKALIQAVSDVSNNIGNLGSKAEREAAMTALSQGDTGKAKQLFIKAIEKGEQEALQTAKNHQNLGALAFFDNTQQAIQAYQRARSK